MSKYLKTFTIEGGFWGRPKTKLYEVTWEDDFLFDDQQHLGLSGCCSKCDMFYVENDCE